MPTFLDLPLDLLPVIISHISLLPPWPANLRTLCLVNHQFNHFATPKLYERISVYSWHKHGKEKVILLFLSLARHPHVAKHVHRLELRDFPKAISRTISLDSGDEFDIVRTVTLGLRNCMNLCSCTWTRDGSLNSEILEALAAVGTRSSGHLRELEINGHSEGNYDPRILLRFTGLQRLSIIMPSNAVVEKLRPWFGITGNSLQSLTLICKASPIITDAKLEHLAPHLPHLEHLHLTGCSKVTHRGIFAVLNATTNGIYSLGLEGLSSKFEMATFRFLCTRTSALRRLRSITLTLTEQIPLQAWSSEVSLLLPATVPLETFRVYSTGSAAAYSTATTSASYEHHNNRNHHHRNALYGFNESDRSNVPTSSSSETLWDHLALAHGESLKRFSVHRMLISLRAIEDICRRCVGLEDLFVVVQRRDLDKLAQCLSYARNLRVVHINFPTSLREVDSDEDEDDDNDNDTAHANANANATASSSIAQVLSEAEALAIVEQCGPNIMQVGCNTRVWQVVREIVDSPARIKRRVVRYQGLDIPEAFLVVRT